MHCDIGVIEKFKQDFESSDLSDKMKALLTIAGSVQKSGKQVTTEQIALAKNAGATDREIHDTVLIAAAFCMFNRYVDGLGTWAPEGTDFYVNRAPMRAEQGYVGSVAPVATL
jgi:alkylhydroperoxidase/carboxymuconolactone decarboxylase family protein YurZ